MTASSGYSSSVPEDVLKERVLDRRDMVKSGAYLQITNILTTPNISNSYKSLMKNNNTSWLTLTIFRWSLSY